MTFNLIKDALLHELSSGERYKSKALYQKCNVEDAVGEFAALEILQDPIVGSWINEIVEDYGDKTVYLQLRKGFSEAIALFLSQGGFQGRETLLLSKEKRAEYKEVLEIEEMKVAIMAARRAQDDAKEAKRRAMWANIIAIGAVVISILAVIWDMIKALVLNK
ncbi:hypothetical protein [Chitinophaga sp. sic0106]|uniref:hypothetical protein n=1 Tax=Chitinophaga sp. sic0106 TaxID=2854785 RepID=UPI001C462B9F|nr:hypothetical protein [Chitinophaga sp. sic0106]MBV7531332.1 hypothetical protein [Chitinophaga sp. sic0106]